MDEFIFFKNNIVKTEDLNNKMWRVPNADSVSRVDRSLQFGDGQKKLLLINQIHEK